jgi:hypothetical protein
MRKFLILATTAVLATVTAVAFAQSPPTGQERANAARLCKAERAAMGATAFAQKYGTNANRRNAFGKCVSKTARSMHQNFVNASEACRAEQADANFAAAHGGKTFTQFYGTNANGSNAFGKCVSQKAQQANERQQQATLNAAQQCKAEQAQLGEQAFRKKYGTNRNGSNAFGNCVSQKAKQR